MNHKLWTMIIWRMSVQIPFMRELFKIVQEKRGHQFRSGQDKEIADFWNVSQILFSN